MKIFSFILLTLLSSCAQVGSLNLRDHQFGVFPTRIIWIQVAGLHEEHLPLLRFEAPTTRDLTSFENVNCFGKMWTYNLYQIRPKPYQGLWSQLTGSKNIKGQCSDFKFRPVWKELLESRYQVGILETGPADSEGTYALDDDKNCPAKKEILHSVYLWEMRPKEKASNLFHIHDRPQFSPGITYYDRSCQLGGCYTDLSRNVEYLFGQFKRNTGHYLFMIRDFSLYTALRNKDLDKAKEILLQLEKIYAYFLNFQKSDTSMLILLTSSSPLNFEYPEQGIDWKKLMEKGEPVLYKNSSLLAPVWAKGARAENFCGLFEESELYYRLLEGPSRPKL